MELNSPDFCSRNGTSFLDSCHSRRSTWESFDRSSSSRPVCTQRGARDMELERILGTATEPWRCLTRWSLRWSPWSCNPNCCWIRLRPPTTWRCEAAWRSGGVGVAVVWRGDGCCGVGARRWRCCAAGGGTAGVAATGFEGGVADLGDGC